ncbi:hypothetical protein [Halorubellus salinus]|uniref:hypothetical protein n=1 Tax=Halorubellus salinus TaxID=755309 RepID=UPI001D093768|nr:hypothetical protein [Halorubellus salinus]
MSRRGWLVLGAAVVVLATTTGTGAFSAVNAERGIQVAVVDDDSAYLGVAITANATGNNTTATITVRNQFSDGTTLTTVTATSDDDIVSLTPGTTTLASGESGTGTVENVTCGETVVIQARGDGVNVEFEREITCE